MTPDVPNTTFDTKQRDALDAAFQAKDDDLAAVASSGLAAAWTVIAPTVNASSGTFVAVSGAGRYCQVGKIVFIEISVTVTTNGTAAGSVIVVLPVTAGPANQQIVGGDIGLTGKMLRGTITADSTSLIIVFYDGTYPGANGAVLNLSGSYESA